MQCVLWLISSQPPLCQSHQNISFLVLNLVTCNDIKILYIERESDKFVENIFVHKCKFHLQILFPLSELLVHILLQNRQLNPIQYPVLKANFKGPQGSNVPRAPWSIFIGGPECPAKLR